MTLTYLLLYIIDEHMILTLHLYYAEAFLLHFMELVTSNALQNYIMEEISLDKVCQLFMDNR